jgi:hypothetical protein
MFGGSELQMPRQLIGAFRLSRKRASPRRLGGRPTEAAPKYGCDVARIICYTFRVLNGPEHGRSPFIVAAPVDLVPL